MTLCELNECIRYVLKYVSTEFLLQGFQGYEFRHETDLRVRSTKVLNKAYYVWDFIFFETVFRHNERKRCITTPWTGNNIDF